MSECLIVAEIGQTHEGSLGNALAFIDAVARTQADGVKFQCHDGDTNTKWRAGVQHPQDKTRQDYWKRTGFSADEWWQLRWRAHRRGLNFGMSAFSEEAYDLCYKLDPDFLKVPLGKSVEGLDSCFYGEIYASWNFEVSPPEEVENISWIQCVPLYPTPPSRLGVKHVGTDICVGLSSHCPEIGPSVEAAKQGAKYIEHHVMWTRDQFGPDVKSSITIDELAELVKAVRAI